MVLLTCVLHIHEGSNGEASREESLLVRWKRKKYEEQTVSEVFLIGDSPVLTAAEGRYERRGQHENNWEYQHEPPSKQKSFSRVSFIDVLQIHVLSAPFIV